MNGKINKYGALEFERGSLMKKQYCPLKNIECECGDWCPLFAEPYRILNTQLGKFELQLCNQTLYFDQLTDERP